MTYEPDASTVELADAVLAGEATPEMASRLHEGMASNEELASWFRDTERIVRAMRTARPYPPPPDFPERIRRALDDADVSPEAARRARAAWWWPAARGSARPAMRLAGAFAAGMGVALAILAPRLSDRSAGSALPGDVRATVGVPPAERAIARYRVTDAAARGLITVGTSAARPDSRVIDVELEGSDVTCDVRVPGAALSALAGDDLPRVDARGEFVRLDGDRGVHARLVFDGAAGSVKVRVWAAGRSVLDTVSGMGGVPREP